MVIISYFHHHKVFVTDDFDMLSYYRKTKQGIDLLSGSQTDIVNTSEGNLQTGPSIEYQVTSNFLAPGESRNDLSFDDEITLEVSSHQGIYT